MKALHRRAAGQGHAARRSKRPGNIVFLAVDRSTGTLLPPGTEGGLAEAFISGTQPGGGLFH